VSSWQPSLAQLIEAYRVRPDCVVYPPCGIPTLAEGHVLSADLRQFYEACGGIALFVETPFAITIVPPDRLVLANPVIFRLPPEGDITHYIPLDDISWSWYIIGEGEPSLGGWYVTIDLSPARLGRCYDSFWDVHPFNSTIIAHSFTELLLKLFPYEGDDWIRDSPDQQFWPSAYRVGADGS
jgi:hypothetical protein